MKLNVIKILFFITSHYLDWIYFHLIKYPILVEGGNMIMGNIYNHRISIDIFFLFSSILSRHKEFFDFCGLHIKVVSKFQKFLKGWIYHSKVIYSTKLFTIFPRTITRRKQAFIFHLGRTTPLKDKHISSYTRHWDRIVGKEDGKIKHPLSLLLYPCLMFTIMYQLLITFTQ